MQFWVKSSVDQSKFFWFTAVLCCSSVLNVSTLSAQELSQFRVPLNLQKEISACLKNLAMQLDGPSQSYQWQFLCPVEQLAEKTFKEPQPALSLLLLGEIEREIGVLRNRLEAEQLTPKVRLRPWGSGLGILSKFLTTNENLDAIPSGVPLGYEAKVQQETLSLVESAVRLVEGLPSYLKWEGNAFLVNIFGESLRFERLVELVEQDPTLWRSSFFRESFIPRAQNWLKTSRTETLASWLRPKIESLKDMPSRSSSQDDFDMWMAFLAISTSDQLRKEEATLKEAVHKLYLFHPKTENQNRLKELLRLKGLPRSIYQFEESDLSFEDKMGYAAALIRSVEPKRAEDILNHFLNASSAELSMSQRWDVFTTHIRLMRLKDERRGIPDLIVRYLKWGNLNDPAAAKGDSLRVQIERQIVMAKYYWTYGDVEKALELVNDVLKRSQGFKEASHSAGEAAYLRARVYEQTQGLEGARPFYEKALPVRMSESLQEDLLWRYFYLRLDLMSADKAKARKELPEMLAVLGRLDVFVKKDISARSKWLYWRAKTFEMAGKLPEALLNYKKCYDNESFSFYSNLSGLELASFKKKPGDWKQKRSSLWPEEPSWERFLKPNGDIKDPAYAELAQVYFLMSVGEWKYAERAFVLLEREMYQRMLGKKVSDVEKRYFARAVAWMRLSLGDAMGALRAAELLRTVSGGELRGEDAFYLYPRPYWGEIQSFARDHVMDPYLVISLIRQESAFNPKAKSSANAMGLMQMIPPVAENEAIKAKIENFQVESLYTPTIALRLGVQHLKGLVNRFNDSWVPSIGSYNAGAEPMDKWLKVYRSPHPAAFIERISYIETRNYVKSILRNYINYQRIYEEAEVDMGRLLKLPVNESIETAKGS